MTGERFSTAAIFSLTPAGSLKIQIYNNILVLLHKKRDIKLKINFFCTLVQVTPNLNVKFMCELFYENGIRLKKNLGRKDLLKIAVKNVISFTTIFYNPRGF